MKTFVISLGGSIIVPDKIDIAFIKKFAGLITPETSKGKRFFIVTGGGAVARIYQKALRALKNTKQEDLDWIGIDATKMNAQVLIAAFGKLARKKLITDPSEHKRDLKKINMVSGWKPGWSTDYVATKIAETYKIDTVINLSNIDYVYNKNPNGNNKNGLKKFEFMSWGQYIQMFGTKWDPGANFPFDPVAARLAKKNGVKVVVMNGQNLKNLKNFFDGKKFKGTVIK